MRGACNTLLIVSIFYRFCNCFSDFTDDEINKFREMSDRDRLGTWKSGVDVHLISSKTRTRNRVILGVRRKASKTIAAYSVLKKV